MHVLKNALTCMIDCTVADVWSVNKMTIIIAQSGCFLCHYDVTNTHRSAKNTNRAKTVKLITITVTSPKSRMQNNTQHCTYYVIILIVVFYRVHCCIITTFIPCKSLWSRLSRRQNRWLSRIFFRPAAGGLAKSMAAKPKIFFQPAAGV